MIQDSCIEVRVEKCESPPLLKVFILRTEVLLATRTVTGSLSVYMHFKLIHQINSPNFLLPRKVSQTAKWINQPGKTFIAANAIQPPFNRLRTTLLRPGHRRLTAQSSEVYNVNSNSFAPVSLFKFLFYLFCLSFHFCFSSAAFIDPPRFVIVDINLFPLLILFKV